MPEARFPLLNIPEWESVDHFQSALPSFKRWLAAEASDFPILPR
jgi:hypothetical protein